MIFFGLFAAMTDHIYPGPDDLVFNTKLNRGVGEFSEQALHG
jgi:hypothetical protein